MADVEAVISDLRELDRGDLERVEAELKRRLREIERDGEAGRPPVSGVLRYKAHEDGYLQAETRTYIRKDGSTVERGPYWYFRFHENGRQKKIYLGKTDDPEGELAKRREARRQERKEGA